MTGKVILGLHFGHDGAVAVIRDGAVVFAIERERLNRRRHAIGIGADDIGLALAQAKVSLAEIDACAVTGTQGIEHLFESPDLSFHFDFRTERLADSPFAGEVDATWIAQRSRACVVRHLSGDGAHPYVRRVAPEVRTGAASLPSLPALEDYASTPSWQTGTGLHHLSEIPAALDERLRHGMHLPLAVRLLGRDIPGYMVSHHFAHAALAYYSSNFPQAAVLSHDGSLPESGYWSGMFYLGSGTRLYPLAPHFLSIGHLYERVAALLGLTIEAGPGKMMGLASYGKPVFFDPAFVGNWFDGPHVPRRHDAFDLPPWASEERHPLLARWMRHCLGAATAAGYDLAPLGDPAQILAPIAVDIAASTQKLLEEVMLEAGRQLARHLEHLGLPAEALCLSGGVALNCPSNSRLAAEGPFRQVFVPPAVHDGGLATGAALAVCHNTFDRPRAVQPANDARTAYLGPVYPGSAVADALTEMAATIREVACDDPIAEAARLLADDRVIGWFQGRSETGPRALGHRSILAHPGHAANWERVNRVKGREHWRPFAPAVLLEHAPDWFEGCPLPSPFMLFTARVRRPDLPAITHVDGTARIQTVDRHCGNFHTLVERFFGLTGIPVVMNTSFNGPGEPIVETPLDALRFFVQSALDALVLEGRLIMRR